MKIKNEINVNILTLELPVGILFNLLIEIEIIKNSNSIIIKNDKTGFGMENNFDYNIDNIDDLKNEFAKYVGDELRHLYTKNLLFKSFSAGGVNIYSKNQISQMINEIKKDILSLDDKKIKIVKKEKASAEYGNIVMNVVDNLGNKNSYAGG